MSERVTFTSKNGRVEPSGWMTPAAWNTVAPPAPANRSSRTAGSRTSPTTASIEGWASSSNGASP